MTAETSWTANSTGSELTNLNGYSLFVQTDPADDAIAAVRRLKDDRDAYQRLHGNVKAEKQAAHGQLVELHELLLELGIPTHCASGQLLTFAQRVSIALLAGRGTEGVK